MDQAKLQDVHNLLVELAYEAGRMMRAATPSTLTSGSKKNSVDLVTETDRAVEKMISSKLQERYPDYAFLGEEGYQPGMRLGTGPTFVVDPIDGTTNFIHANGTGVCVSLALCDKKVPVVGVIYNPFTDNLYSAIRGQGSFLNRKIRLPLKSPVPPLTGLNAALVAVEWGSDRSGNNWDVKINTFKNLGQQGKGMVHSMRSLGSAALNFCNVASGVIDIYWEAGCWAWDVAAGWLILEESGGLVADANPAGPQSTVDPWKPAVDGRRYLAVRACGEGGRSQREIVEEFWSHVAGRFEYEN